MTITQKGSSWTRKILLVLTFILLSIGVYIVSIVAAPEYMPLFVKPIDIAQLPKPTVSRNRIVIAKLGVDIEYGTNGKASLDRGALWRYPMRGNPQDGGNFIIAAHRFTIQPTPQETVKKSPFFHIDKLEIGDEIVIDYEGKRYYYNVIEMKSVRSDQTEIERATDDARLTLYSCDFGGSRAGRVVVIARSIS